jgi:amidohydrolase
MIKNSAAFILYIFLTTNQVFSQINLDNAIDKDLNDLITTYKTMHAAPELSGHEQKTSAFIAAQLKALGYNVTENVGRFQNRNWKGYGVTGVMKNGNGPTVLVRTDMDALPVIEKTNLSYASTVITKNDAGEEVGVMHACGHDIHMTVFLGVAKMLVETKMQWHGTIVMVAQPAEEAGPGASGAEALLLDSMYSRFPKPDYILGLHQVPDIIAGKVGISPGYTTSISGAGEIIVRGKGGHSSKPQDAKDPVVIAAELIMALQTIVSRETNPLTPATLTIGSIQGGTAGNIIADEVHMKFNLRTLDENECDKMIASVIRIARGVGIAAGLPDDKLPIVNVTKGYPANYNDPDLTKQIIQVFEKAIGKNNVTNPQPSLIGEDFSYYSLGKKIPSLFFLLGSTDSLKYNESMQTGVALPSLHSPLMAPSPDITIKTGIKTMTSAVLELLKK